MKTIRFKPNFFVALLLLGLVIFSIFSGKFIAETSSKLLIAVILGFLFSILILVNTDAALILLIFSMLLSPEMGMGQVPGREVVIRVDDILLAIITFTWLAKTAVNKGLALFIKTPLNKAISLYIMVCVVSTLRGAVVGYVNPTSGFFYVLRYIEYFLLFILVANHIHSKKQIKYFLTAFFITCAVVSVYGIMQIPSGIRVSAPFEGEIGEPNTFGGYLLFILCIASGIVLQKVSKRIKFALIGMGVLSFIPFLFTLSRASYLAIIFSFVTFIILSRKKLELTAVVLAVILIGLIFVPEAIFSRVKYTFQQRESRLVRLGDTYLDPSASARIISWKESFQAWKKTPIMGRGVAGYFFVDGQYVRNLVETGIIGLSSFLWLFWLIFKHSHKIFREREDELYKGICLGFIAGFVGLSIHALTANTFIIIRIMEPFWFMAGIVMMLPALEKQEVSSYGDDLGDEETEEKKKQGIRLKGHFPV
ncbi:MAG: O-antigen ligase family protein [Candidatus Aminicenantes bacterium]|nr:O-antigen ligase family protein [Candidatus Aminicenantes bacterium]